MTADVQAQLVRRFRDQQQFSLTYSTLYASLFGTVATWLSSDPNSVLSRWLVDAAHARPAFDVTNLLAAGLHRDLLADEPAVAGLRPYYPSVGGRLAAGAWRGEEWRVARPFATALETAVLARRQVLRSFIQKNTVQTNETGRGLAWLLPAAIAGFEQVELIDLGASAGLNLVADRRRFELQGVVDGRPLPVFGRGESAAFSVSVAGWPDDLPTAALATPVVRQRDGLDLHPFRLRTPDDELTLASFVWGDQPQRLARLRDGMAVLKRINQGATPVQLHPVVLPNDLPDYLAVHVSTADAPVICYNTYVRMYLPDTGSALQQHIASWATAGRRPAMWIQWEPPSCLTRSAGSPPQRGWLAWTVDLWQAGEHRRWLLGWVHPHGHQVQLQPDFEQFVAYGLAQRGLW